MVESVPQLDPSGPAALATPVRQDGATVISLPEPEGRGELGGAARPAFSQVILNIGFLAALVMAGASFATGGVHLSTFLNRSTDSIGKLWQLADSPGGGAGSAKPAAARLTPDEMQVAIAAQVTVARLGLLSCAIFVGMAFGFLGFSLFLIGVREEMRVEAEHRSQTLKLTRLAPGVFVILCATVLIGVCATHTTRLDFSTTVGRPATAGVSPVQSLPPVQAIDDDLNELDKTPAPSPAPKPVSK
jgi:hypothetical protein